MREFCSYDLVLPSAVQGTYGASSCSSKIEHTSSYLSFITAPYVLELLERLLSSLLYVLAYMYYSHDTAYWDMNLSEIIMLPFALLDEVCELVGKELSCHLSQAALSESIGKTEKLEVMSYEL